MMFFFRLLHERFAGTPYAVHILRRRVLNRHDRDGTATSECLVAPEPRGQRGERDRLRMGAAVSTCDLSCVKRGISIAARDEMPANALKQERLARLPIRLVRPHGAISCP